MFRDKVYEEMDEISKMIEPYICETNEHLSMFPDKTEVTYEMLTKYALSKWGTNSVSLENLVEYIADSTGNNHVKRNAYNFARDFFEFQVEDLEEDEMFRLDLDNETMSHKLYVVKKKIALDDEEIEKDAFRRFERALISNLNSNKKMNKPRMNDVADLFGAYNVRKDRSWRGKLNKLHAHIKGMFDDNTLEIRNAELYEKLGHWIGLYVRNGNLAAFKNLTKIKIMTHQDKPIYSIEEEQV
jgi:hypothetical protein